MKQCFKYAVMFIAASALLFTGCKKEKETESEAYIISLTINNGGLTGTDRYTGTVDKDNRTVVFNEVAAETNLAAVTFEARLSIGSSLDKKEYNFLETATEDATAFEQVVAVVPEFGDNVVYKVTINTKPAEQAPLLDRLVIKDDDGAEHTLTMSDVIDGVLLLGIPQSTKAEIVEVVVRPARATYEFTTATDNIINFANPGALRISFMGLETEYQISFDGAAAAGADFTKAKVHAWTKANGNEYFDLADENTRSGDIDENYILLVNRAGERPNPYLLNIDDVLNDNVDNKIQLNVTGVEGGTFAVSSGRLTQGHIYICNLQSPKVSEDTPFIIYHWDSPTAVPEKVVEWTGEFVNDENLFNLRLGDNMGLSLDAAGNGYAFFAGQETATDRIVRFTVTNFNKFSDPTVITHSAQPQYYNIYNKVGENEYLFKGANKPNTLWLLDKDANELYTLEFLNADDCSHATDFHIVEFNRGRYLVCSNTRRYLYFNPEALLVYDITKGMNNAEALKTFNENRPFYIDDEDPDFPEKVEQPFEPIFKYEYSSGAPVENACCAICNAVVRGDKLVILSAAPTAGLVVVEVPMVE